MAFLARAALPAEIMRFIFSNPARLRIFLVCAHKIHLPFRVDPAAASKTKSFSVNYRVLLIDVFRFELQNVAIFAQKREICLLKRSEIN